MRSNPIPESGRDVQTASTGRPGVFKTGVLEPKTEEAMQQPQTNERKRMQKTAVEVCPKSLSKYCVLPIGHALSHLFVEGTGNPFRCNRIHPAMSLPSEVPLSGKNSPTFEAHPFGDSESESPLLSLERGEVAELRRCGDAH